MKTVFHLLFSGLITCALLAKKKAPVPVGVPTYYALVALANQKEDDGTERPEGRRAERPEGRRTERPEGRRTERPEGRRRKARRTTGRKTGRKARRTTGRKARRTTGRKARRTTDRKARRTTLLLDSQITRWCISKASTAMRLRRKIASGLQILIIGKCRQ